MRDRSSPSPRAAEIAPEAAPADSGRPAASPDPHKTPGRRHATLSGIPVKTVYGPGDAAHADERNAVPGEFPYTRGIHADMYRGKLWTMRMFAGFGSPEDTNRRFHYLLEHGQTGLSTAFDMPTLMGY